MSVKTIRKQFLREFRGLRKSSSVAAGLIVGCYLLQILAAIGVGFLLLSGAPSPAEITALAVIGVFIGTRFRGLNNIVHECSHFTFCREVRHNVTFGSICAALILGSYRDYRDEHMTHHAHLGDAEKDKDLQGVQHLRLEEPLTWTVILRHFLTAISGAHLPYYFRPNLSARDGERYRLFKLTLVAAAIAFLILYPVPALVLVWLPFVWAFSAINYWTDCIDHGGLLDSEDELEASRNLPLPSFLRVIFFPRNDCYHLVHHLFPQVPAVHLHACHERLLTDPVYRVRATDPALPINSAQWQLRRMFRMPRFAGTSR